MTAGIVVAGGTSRRFGPEDKALATVAGSSMLRHVVDALEPIVDDVVVNCRAIQHPTFESELSGHDRIRFAIDPVPDGGPVVGLESACAAVNDDVALVVGCDFPLVTTTALASMLTRLESRAADAVVPWADGRRQPLCGAYRVDALEAAIDALGSVRGRRVGEVHERLVVHDVSVEELPGSDRAFWNVNTRADLERAERFLRDRAVVDERPSDAQSGQPS